MRVYECTLMTLCVLEAIAFVFWAIAAMHVQYTVERFEPAQGLAQKTYDVGAIRESWRFACEIQQSPFESAPLT